MSISNRGVDLAKIGFDHGKLDDYDPVHNPNGMVRFLYAENVGVSGISACLLNADGTKRG